MKRKPRANNCLFRSGKGVLLERCLHGKSLVQLGGLWGADHLARGEAKYRNYAILEVDMGRWSSISFNDLSGGKIVFAFPGGTLRQEGVARGDDLLNRSGRNMKI